MSPITTSAEWEPFFQVLRSIADGCRSLDDPHSKQLQKWVTLILDASKRSSDTFEKVNELVTSKMPSLQAILQKTPDGHPFGKKMRGWVLTLPITEKEEDRLVSLAAARAGGLRQRQENLRLAQERQESHSISSSGSNECSLL